MKLLRVGEIGNEIVATLDSNNKIRDLSDHIEDLNPQTINDETLNKLRAIDLTGLKEINSKIRIGACISNPVDFLAIGLNYKACLLYTSPSPRDVEESRMPSSA